MQCISASDNFTPGIKFVPHSEDPDMLVFCPDGCAAHLAFLSVSNLMQMIDLGHVNVDNMVMTFALRGERRRKNKYNEATILRADLTMVDGQVHLVPEADSPARASQPRRPPVPADLLLAMESDHRRFANSDITALGGAEILSRSHHTGEDMAHRTFLLARMRPGSAVRAYIAKDNGQLEDVQYISNMALSVDGRELIKHG